MSSAQPGEVQQYPPAAGSLGTLQPLTAALLGCVTPAEVVETVVARGVEVLGAEAGLVVMVRGGAGKEYLDIVGARGYSEEILSSWQQFPLAASLPLSDAVREQTPFFSPTRAAFEARYPEIFQQGPTHTVRASASLPLVARGRALGGLHLSFPAEREVFTETDRAFLEELARQCSLALDRALLLQEREAAQVRQEFLVQASAVLAESLNYQTTLDSIARLAVPTLCDWMTVDMVDEAGLEASILRLEVAAHVDPAEVEGLRELRRRSPIDMTQTAQPPVAAILSRKTILLPEITPEIVAASARNEDQRRHIERLAVRSLISVPLRMASSSAPTGAVTLAFTHASGRTFTPELVALTEELARRAAVAVDNARLFERAQHEVAERTRAERQAEQIAAELRLITDAAPLLISYIGTDLCYRFVNKGYAEWFGSSPKNIVGRPAESVIGPTAFAKVKQRLLNALSGKRLAFEEALAYDEGHIRYVHADYVPDTDQEGRVRGVVAVVSDITARRQAELAQEAALDAAEAARHQTEVVLESIGEMFYALDASFRLTYVNRRVEEAWGKSRKELLGRVLWDVLPQAIGSVSYHAQQEAMRERRTLRFETVSPVLRRWIECSCYPAEGGGISVYFRDIQEQKEAEEALRASEARHRRLAREMLYSLTEGRMRLADTVADLPAPLSEASSAVLLSAASLRVLRQQVAAVAARLDFVPERRHDLLTAVGEAAMNAAKHARNGLGRVHADAERGRIQVWVVDEGPGIVADQIHRALERGWTTGGFGHGWWFILKAVDRVYLLTGPGGTTVVLEMERNVAVPLWLAGSEPVL